MPTRFSRSARSPRCSPRCCLPTWWCVARCRPAIPWPNFCPPACKVPEFRRRADHAARSCDLHIGPAAHAVQFRAEGHEQSVMRLHRRAALRLSSRTTSSASRRASITNTPISASACWAMRWPCARGKSYEELVVSRICAPLGMDDTRITLSRSMQATSGARSQRQSRAGGKLGHSGTGGRRRAPFDGERSALSFWT